MEMLLIPGNIFPLPTRIPQQWTTMKRLLLGLFCLILQPYMNAMEKAVMRDDDPLCTAARESDMQALRKLIAGTKNHVVKHQALQEAVKNRHLAAILLLIEAGAEESYSLLLEEMRREKPNKEVIGGLFNASQTIGEKAAALKGAAELGLCEYVELFLRTPFSQNQLDHALWAAISAKKSAAIPLILRAGVSDSAKLIAVRDAAENNDEQAIALLLAAGVKDSKALMQALRFAMIHKNPFLIACLKAHITDNSNVDAFEKALESGFQNVQLDGRERRCAFRECVRAGNMPEIKAFLKSGIRQEKELELAAEAQNLIVAEMLLKAGVPEYVRDNSLLQAVRKRLIKIIPLILKYSSPTRLSWCEEAIDKDDAEVVALFAFDRTDACDIYEKSKQAEARQLILDLAIKKGSFNVLQMLLSMDPTLKKKALFFAVCWLNVSAVKLLLELGVDSSAKDEAVACLRPHCKSDKDAPVDPSCLEIMRLLCNAGLSDDAKEELLFWASINDTLSFVKLIVESGISDKMRTTALITVARNERYKRIYQFMREFEVMLERQQELEFLEKDCYICANSYDLEANMRLQLPCCGKPICKSCVRRVFGGMSYTAEFEDNQLNRTIQLHSTIRSKCPFCNNNRIKPSEIKKFEKESKK